MTESPAPAPSPGPEPPLLSVVVPCHDERDNLRELHRRLAEAFPTTGTIGAEFVLVDDGSTDGTGELLDQLAQGDPRVVPIHLAERSGQTAALWHGLQAARGDWIAHLDGDLQNDPADLPPMLERAREGDLDAVLGYRSRRHDDGSRRWASRAANAIRRTVLRDTIRDVGCSTRVVRREVLSSLPPVPNQHRYLPALIQRGGWSCIQIPTRHHERRHGSSKYGNLGRALDGLRDLPRMIFYLRRVRRARREKVQR